MFLNRFEVLKSRIIQRGKESRRKEVKNKSEILREEKAKREVKVWQIKVKEKEKREKMLREVVVKIGLKQEEEKEGIVVEVLLDNGATKLVISEEFAKKHKFRRTKLERLIYMRNVDDILNYVGPI